MEEILIIICMLLTLWGMTDIIWRIILWLTLEKHTRQRVFVLMGQNDDPWFVLRGLRERAALCGLKKRDDMAVIGCGLSPDKCERVDEMCRKQGISFCRQSDIEKYVSGLYNKDNKKIRGT